MIVYLYATLRPIVGGRTVELPGGGPRPVRQLLDELFSRYPLLRPELVDEYGQLHRHVHVFVNGRDVYYLDDQMDVLLTGDDVVAIFPAVAGG